MTASAPAHNTAELDAGSYARALGLSVECVVVEVAGLIVADVLGNRPFHFNDVLQIAVKLRICSCDDVLDRCDIDCMNNNLDFDDPYGGTSNIFRSDEVTAFEPLLV